MNEHLDHLIALAAMGELTEAEQAELDVAAAADPEVAAELDADLQTAGELLASTPIRPPVDLRASVLAAIADTPQKEISSSSTAGDPSPVAVPVPSGDVVDLASARSRRTRRFTPALAAAAAVVVLAMGSFVLLGRDRSDTGSVASVVSADDAVSRSLDNELGWTLTVVHSPGEDAIVIEGEAVDELPTAEEYVLWLLSDGTATPVGGFRPDSDGMVEVRLDGVDPTDLMLGVTVEPVGGAVTPTLPVLANA